MVHAGLTHTGQIQDGDANVPEMDEGKALLNWVEGQVKRRRSPYRSAGSDETPRHVHPSNNERY